MERLTGLSAECYDCCEFYATCRGWSEKKEWACADFRRLPDVGKNGQTGQVVPPSRMEGRTEPHVKRGYVAPEAQIEVPRRQRVDRAAGPQAVYDSDGVRRCACGQAIPPKKRCCNDCREKRRQETMQSRRKPSKVPAP